MRIYRSHTIRVKGGRGEEFRSNRESPAQLLGERSALPSSNASSNAPERPSRLQTHVYG